MLSVHDINTKEIHAVAPRLSEYAVHDLFVLRREGLVFSYRFVSASCGLFKRIAMYKSVYVEYM